MDFRDHLAGQKEDYFWFKAKNQLVDILLERILPKSGPARILCLGVGTGGELDVLKQYGQVWAVDISQETLALIPGCQVHQKLQADACALPFASGFFDAVVALDVLEHIPDDILAISECHRVLKPGGGLVMTVPAHAWLFGEHDKALGHCRRYNRCELGARFNAWRSVSLAYWNALTLLPALFLRRSKPAEDKLTAWVNGHARLNRLLCRFLYWENWLIKKGHGLPVGLSLVGVCCK